MRAKEIDKSNRPVNDRDVASTSAPTPNVQETWVDHAATSFNWALKQAQKVFEGSRPSGDMRTCDQERLHTQTPAPSKLPVDLEFTFSGGKYSSRVLEKDIILYRGGNSNVALGQFFSKDRPIHELQVRIDKGIPPKWPNGDKSVIDTIYKVRIPAGTTIHTGQVSSQNDHFVGGTQQIVIEKPWLLKGVEVLEKIPLK